MHCVLFVCSKVFSWLCVCLVHIVPILVHVYPAGMSSEIILWLLKFERYFSLQFENILLYFYWFRIYTCSHYLSKNRFLSELLKWVRFHLNSKLKLVLEINDSNWKNLLLRVHWEYPFWSNFQIMADLTLVGTSSKIISSELFIFSDMKTIISLISELIQFGYACTGIGVAINGNELAVSTFFSTYSPQSISSDPFSADFA